MLAVQRGNMRRVARRRAAIVAAWAQKKSTVATTATRECYGNPLGVECEACKRRAPVALDRLGTLDGNVQPPWNWPFKCCGPVSLEPAQRARPTKAARRTLAIEFRQADRCGSETSLGGFARETARHDVPTIHDI